MIDSQLKNKAVELLQNRPAWMTLKAISEATKIPEGWLKMLAQDKIEEPSVVRIEALYNHLSNQPLKV